MLIAKNIKTKHPTNKMMIKTYFSLFLPFLQKIPIVAKAFCTNKALVLLPFFTMPIFTTQINIITFLFGSLAFDFATGVAVSYKNKRDEEKKLAAALELDRLKKLKETNLISSKKLKQTGIKTLLYLSSILVAYWSDQTLQVKHFHFEFSKIDYTITILVTLWWIVVEIYSIFFENFKDLGFDILKVFTNLKKLYKQVKNNETSHN